jgi:protein TonB
MEATLDPIGQLAEVLRRDQGWVPLATAAAACVHLAIAVGVARARFTRDPGQHEAPTVLDIDLPSPPSSTSPATTPLSPSRAAEAPPTAPPPPGSAARPAHAAPASAGSVMTRQPDPNEPVDLTSSGFVIGSASAYVGGQTATAGDRTTPAPTQTSPMVPASVPRAASPLRTPGSDRSRRASVVGTSAWKCPFPSEADADSVDEAAVTIRVTVEPAGSVGPVAILTDAGHGFGRAAKQCALSKSWDPARDANGIPTEGTVTVRVRFER